MDDKGNLPYFIPEHVFLKKYLPSSKNPCRILKFQYERGFTISTVQVIVLVQTSMNTAICSKTYCNNVRFKLTW